MANQQIHKNSNNSTCCNLEDHFDEEHKHNRDNPNMEGHEHSHAEGSLRQMFLPSIFSLILLLSALVLEYFIQVSWFEGWVKLVWYLIAYLPVGLPVLKDAIKSMQSGDFFSEFLLMGIATIGAFAIGEYPEGVAVMLFYSVGEIFQTLAVKRAKTNIKSLLDQRPDEVTILQDGNQRRLNAKSVSVDTIIVLKPGEKVALDAILLSDSASFNTSALTGESKPDTKRKGDAVLAGMINLNSVAQVRVTAPYADSKLSKILDLVQNANAQKAPTELFIRKFAKIYTPIVVFLAIAIFLLPYFFVSDYRFADWLYRALVFLVISCPCALVISIPLGYFGGIGAASRHGILIKGSHYLDTLAQIQHVVMDKTGTLTEGVFKVKNVVFHKGIDQSKILPFVNALESQSTHPVASAIHEFVGTVDSNILLVNIEEIAGQGLKGIIQGKEMLVGNFKLLDTYHVKYNFEPKNIAETVIAVAYDQQFIGYLTIADRIKADAKQALAELKTLGVQTTMLSGDKTSVVVDVAKNLNIQNAFGDLLPEDKVTKFKEIKTQNARVAFVGDGVNDAPVVALSDVGIAMGGLGSDATIETADVVIQDDKPSKIPLAIRIGRQTKKIVWQNISMAFIVKGIVLILGAGGFASMWEAVFADVGVTLLAILNAVRIQRMKF